jgi:hypothetical protein
MIEHFSDMPSTTAPISALLTRYIADELAFPAGTIPLTAAFLP